MLAYLCTSHFNAEHDAVVAWDDPDIGIDWPLAPESLSAKDRDAPRLKDISIGDLPRMAA